MHTLAPPRPTHRQTQQSQQTQRTHQSDTGDWRQESRCLDASPDDFFPVGQGPAAREQAERAKGVCSRCAVREQCLDLALAGNIQHGVFGGLDEDERRALAAEARRRPA